jgi:peptide/nickel transport system substrate-binding protein
VFPYDPRKANQTLDDAGWLRAPDNIRQKAGQRLAFDLVFFPDYANLATIIQAELRQIGVDLNLKMLDQSAAGVLTRNGQASSFLIGSSASDPSILTGAFHSRSIGGSGQSGAIIKDPRFDALLDQAAVESNAGKQCQLYQEFEQQYLESAAAYPVWEVVQVLGLRSNVEGIRLVAGAPNLPVLQEVYLDN